MGRRIAGIRAAGATWWLASGARTASWLAFAVSIAVGCAPQIGDECTTSADCDIQGARICDRTMPDGYCTVQGCERGTCPENSECVLFRPEPMRLSATWCMASCDGSGDCRSGYRCMRADQLGENLAINLDGARRRFCAVPGTD